MYHFATALCAGIIATVVVGGAAFAPTPAEAATTSGVETAALKETTATCKAEAKEKNIKWPASRKYVSNCVAKAIKLTPAELQKTVVNQAIVACKAEAKGKKIRWPASRKFVSTCLSNALKDYHLDVDLIAQRAQYSRSPKVHTRGNWMYAERLLRGTVKPPFRALAVLAITSVLVGSSTFAQTPPSVFSPTPFVDRGAEKSRARRRRRSQKMVWAAKSRLGHKKLSCEAGIDL